MDSLSTQEPFYGDKWGDREFNPDFALKKSKKLIRSNPSSRSLL
jgi:hypothetical protein